MSREGIAGQGKLESGKSSGSGGEGKKRLEFWLRGLRKKGFIGVGNSPSEGAGRGVRARNRSKKKRLARTRAASSDARAGTGRHRAGIRKEAG